MSPLTPLWNATHAEHRVAVDERPHVPRCGLGCSAPSPAPHYARTHARMHARAHSLLARTHARAHQGPSAAPRRCAADQHTPGMGLAVHGASGRSAHPEPGPMISALPPHLLGLPSPPMPWQTSQNAQLQPRDAHSQGVATCPPPPCCCRACLCSHWWHRHAASQARNQLRRVPRRLWWRGKRARPPSLGEAGGGMGQWAVGGRTGLAWKGGGACPRPRKTGRTATTK